MGSLALRRALTRAVAPPASSSSRPRWRSGWRCTRAPSATPTDRTIAAKAAVASPSDVVVPLVRRAVEDGPLPAGSTLVGTELGITLEPGDLKADLLVLDPDTFPAVAHWDDSLSGRPLGQLIDAITEYDGDRLPVVVAGSLSEDVAPVGREFTLSSVATTRWWSRSWAGRMRSGPAVAAPDAASPTWTRSPAGLVAAGRTRPGCWSGRSGRRVRPHRCSTRSSPPAYAYEESEIVAADGFTARPEVRAQAWSLAYLRGVSLAAGLLALIGIAMHALAQQRRRTVAALLLGRMGMTRRSTDAATALEIGLLTGTAALVAALVALPASALVLDLLDPVPTLLPEPLFTVPWGSLAVVLTGVVGVTAGGALLVGRAARRTVPGEVLREAP